MRQMTANITLLLTFSTARAAPLPGFSPGSWFGEQVCEFTIDPEVRVVINAPSELQYDATRPTRLVIYALPNGNTIEQTLGCRMEPGLDWHYDIQHIAAQTRRLREVTATHNIVLASIEAKGLSWPAWRGRHADPGLLPAIVAAIKARLPDGPTEVVLSAHSGGGSFVLGYVAAVEAIPGDITRIALLDANYAYDAAVHGDKLRDWLAGDAERQLVVLAYDDREITLDGKKVVGPTGGTYRATQRMLARFDDDETMTTTHQGDLDIHTARDGQIYLLVHNNPANKILHTALVGEMNGYLHALTWRTPQHFLWSENGDRHAAGESNRGAAESAAASQSPFSARAYDKWITPLEVGTKE